MARYLVKRLLWFVPTLVVVALVAFGLSRLAPGDPVELYLHDKPFGAVSTPQEFFRAERDVRQVAQLLGQDKPPFYFSILPDFFPDTLSRILQKDHRHTLRRLLLESGSWSAVQSWHRSLRELELAALQPMPAAERSRLNQFKNRLRSLYTLTEAPTIRRNLDSLQALLHRDSLLAANLQPALTRTQTAFQGMEAQEGPGWFFPSLRWHGTDNQFHQWLTDFFRGDFGLSYFDRRPVADKLKPALFKTLIINVLAILLAYLVAVPLGVWAAARRGSPFDRITTALLLALYSLPAFWAGTMLLVFFTTPEYGMDWFEGVGWTDLPADAPWWDRFRDVAAHIFLPVLCVAYPPMAFLFRQMRGAMLQALDSDYVLTARAKGLPESTILWKHAFRNALFPIITLFAGVFPRAIAGSVAIEFIFNIHGMGLLALEALYESNWPVVFTVLMLGAVLTLTGILVADLLYALADPRVRYER